MFEIFLIFLKYIKYVRTYCKISFQFAVQGKENHKRIVFSSLDTCDDVNPHYSCRCMCVYFLVQSLKQSSQDMLFRNWMNITHSVRILTQRSRFPLYITFDIISIKLLVISTSQVSKNQLLNSVLNTNKPCWRFELMRSCKQQQN